jgi:pimeloyl-ACP methyl ester carboxylesterase
MVGRSAPTAAWSGIGSAGEFHEFFLSCTQNGPAPGSQGWWDDNCMLEPWGFDLADIAVPVLLLYGGQDVFVPTGHGEWLTQHIPGVEAHLLDDDGHATLVNHVPESHAWLSEHLCASTLIGMRARLRFRGRRTEEMGHTQLDMAGQPR